ncbi:MAG TPA: GNAT family N-acetyltransferase [Candidatus Bathyarchaeia archaeon]|nr:GNAT family N-acetyltransferase [Candidatus Bathyarchaeia archaeon]
MNIQPIADGQETIIAEIHNQAFQPWLESLGQLYGYHKITSQDVLSWKEKNKTVWLTSINTTPIAYAHCSVDEFVGSSTFKKLVFVETLESLGQSKLAVLPKYQRKGVAKSFLQKLLDHYCQNNVQIALVLAYSDNEASSKLLTSLGFTHQKVFYYEPFSLEEPFSVDSVLATFNLHNPIPIPRLNKDVVIRLIKEDDLSNIRLIFDESRPDAFGPHPSIERIREWYHSGWGEVTLIAELSGEAVGCMEFTSQGIIGIPGVLKEFQGKGVGTTLFYNLLRTMQERGHYIALADTGYILEDAIRMYKRFQFNLCRELWSWVKIL